MRFALYFIILFTINGVDVSKQWRKEIKYLCDESTSFLVLINQSQNPFNDVEINSIAYKSNVRAVFHNSDQKKRISGVRSNLIYQCALCAPYKLMGGNDTLSFNISKIFDLPGKVNGKLYLEFQWEEIPVNLLHDNIDCFRSRVLQFEVIR